MVLRDTSNLTYFRSSYILKHVLSNTLVLLITGTPENTPKFARGGRKWPHRGCNKYIWKSRSEENVEKCAENCIFGFYCS